ncbi:MAG: T9SS type A sorting domain-containing protein [Ignavibacteriae bacterium]|nr:T9SS type A sorting domain-containing protein [Ignavibacteriota bacterium]
MVLWLPPDEVSIAKAEEYEMEYILRAGSLLGEHDYLRAPDNTVPEDLTQEDLTKLDGMIEQFKDREKVLGYYLTDEPNQKAFSNLGKVVNYLREKDPTRLSFINLLPTYSSDEQFGTPTYDEHIEQYLDIVKPELLSYDHYHFFNTYDGGGYFNNLGIIRKWALRYDIPFCNIIQAIGTNGTTVDFLDWRIPNEDEHRWLVYSSLAYGAKAIIWFHWDHSWGLTSSPERDALYTSIQKLNQEMNNLGDILINLESQGVYHSKITSGEILPTDGIVKTVSEESDLLVGYFKDNNDNDYFMLMNKDYSESITSEVTLNYILDSLQYFNADENEWEDLPFENSISGATINLPLKPGGGKLLKFKGETIVGLSDGTKAPTQFELKQNYPNPFNPSTAIKYSIANVVSENLRSVQLKIYDILGREVTTLVNKKQKPGKYEVKFNARNLTSGLYFYRLKTEEFLQTKKMMYLK